MGDKDMEMMDMDKDMEMTPNNMKKMVAKCMNMCRDKMTIEMVCDKPKDNDKDMEKDMMSGDKKRYRRAPWYAAGYGPGEEQPENKELDKGEMDDDKEFSGSGQKGDKD